jgi:hypothetical protein
VFDSHQEYSGRFKTGFDVFKQKNPTCSRYLLPPFFEKETDYLCLQAADLFVYEVRRTVSNHFYEPHRCIRIAMGRLFPQALNTYVLGYDILKSLAEGQKDDRIPIQTLEEEEKIS